jgi:PHD/YefM family antitoxin component YafN of YafNO toxin-antitoxin module
MEIPLAKTGIMGYNIRRLTEEESIMTNVQPSTILGTYYNDLSAFCKENRETVFITKDGKDDLAVMSMEMYEALSKQELYRLLDEGRTAALEGRMRPMDEVFDELEQKIIDGRL